MRLQFKGDLRVTEKHQGHMSLQDIKTVSSSVNMFLCPEELCESNVSSHIYFSDVPLSDHFSWINTRCLGYEDINKYHALCTLSYFAHGSGYSYVLE